MPIRNLDAFLAERGLLQTAALSDLKGARLGIEGTAWVKKVMRSYTGVTRSNSVPAIIPLDGPGPSLTNNGGSASEMTVTAAGGRIMDSILGTVVCMGGTPPLATLETIVERELNGFKQYDIQPFFVFKGLDITKRERPFTAEDARPGKRNRAWDEYSRNLRDQAMTLMVGSNSLNFQDYLHIIMRILAEKNVEFMRAPYFAWAQLAYLQQLSIPDRPWISAIHSTTEILLYDVDSVITQIDFDRGIFTYVNKQNVLHDLGVYSDQFLDICLIAGFDWVWTFPPLNVQPPEAFQFITAVKFVTQAPGGVYAALAPYKNSPTVIKRNYIDEFMRARCAVKYHMVLTETATVEPMNKEAAPGDMDLCIGPRLPDEIYFYMSQGLISPTVLNAITSGYYLEHHPLDNGETNEYRTFLESEDIVELRAQALGLLTWGLHKQYQSKRVATLHWYDSNTEYQIPHNYDPPLPARWINEIDKITGVKKPNVQGILPLTFSRSSAWVHTEMKRQKTDQADFRFVINTVAALDAKQVHNVKEKTAPLTAVEFQATASSRVLELRGLSRDSYSLTPVGQAFKRGLDVNGRNRPASLHEELLLCLELVRSKRLNGSNYHPTYQPRAVIEGFSPVVTSYIQLASRVMSLVTVQMDALKYWTGPFDRDLLVFQSFAKLIARNIRCIAEMLLMCVVMHELPVKSRENPTVLDEAFNCGLQLLPYAIEPSTALGIIGRSYLEAVAKHEVGGKPMDLAKEAARKQVAAQFGGYCKNVEGDLKRGFCLWNSVAEMTRVLAAEKQIPGDVAKEIADADAWLRCRFLDV
ncbi:hypothetical protein SeLEV6574_g01139 [Synchytrium endobioticum]|uniref:XPG-I domain-containing protein n=1 Tax=Synchytrium endobioticum TaxID=286115 RepID=A0A507DGH3_9FUNG|nr:hypothetical protein SeLEV6574_g01139 [Synchytrium endobioticum]